MFSIPELLLPKVIESPVTANGNNSMDIDKINSNPADASGNTEKQQNSLTSSLSSSLNSKILIAPKLLILPLIQLQKYTQDPASYFSPYWFTSKHYVWVVYQVRCPSALSSYPFNFIKKN